MIIQITISIFLLLELSNVLSLYFNPGTTTGNAMGVFKQWEQSKEDEDTHLLLLYMARWVAGTKLIFILLLIVIILFGNPLLQLYSLMALIASILTYYIALSPIISKMDSKDLIEPKGYSKTLSKIIGGFVIALSMAGIVDYLLYS